ncbi:PREDICTED: NKG2D ligand 1 [Elephantulus edwardii]|uniref:NKG2D ligand 1 n=1 Tax=Elephantulus edwardii TaxID=28737 RepID=UPI0003F079D2|nr:PREDICTED: NKG2D ligand 1 [Elephantulus edwardii]
MPHAGGRWASAIFHAGASLRASRQSLDPPFPGRYLTPTAPKGTHTLTVPSRRKGVQTLCYNFSIMFKSSPGQPWCEVQSQVDENLLCHFDCENNKVMKASLLGKKLNTMKEWEEQLQTLRDIGVELRQRVPDIELENYSPSAPVTLQAKMCCQLDTGGSTTSSWLFGFDGQLFLLFNPETMKWIQIHPGARLMKKAWERDGDLIALLKRTSRGDCRVWLKPWVEELQPPV